MKNLSASILLICLSIFAELPAQTLKNIYRHNLPVLRIPTALIDKVETAEIDGQQTLRVIQFNGFVSQIPIAQIDSITHTDGTALDPAQLGNLRTASVMGVVRDTGNAPINMAIVRSPFGGEETRTDANGVFYFNNILVYDNLGYITIEKPGYYKGSRSFLPNEESINQVNVELMPMVSAGFFVNANGGVVNAGSLQLTFPPNSIQLNGQPYTGQVIVYAKALDVSSNRMFNQMPGELLGGVNDSLRLLRSFGMAAIELRTYDLQQLQLANGVSATLRFTIPTLLQANAPDAIDLWSFDEALGYWKLEGQAQKQGTQYIGSASHFSWWNCDVPADFVNYSVTVNSADGNPISNAQIRVVSPNMGTGVVYTNAFGEFNCRVPKNESLNLEIYLTCTTASDWTLAYSQTISSGIEPLIGTYTASLSGYYPISGTLLNCQGQPVTAGYVKMGSQIYSADSSGAFSYLTCTLGANNLRGFDASNPDSVRVSEYLPINVETTGANAGSIEVCEEVYGTVSDIDGNVYSTVLIGGRWIMAENLKTAHFRNGSVISNLVANASWTDTIPAWCHYQHNPTYEYTFGKMYNWYCVSDTSGLCPAGWHVPTDAEWTALIDSLGGEAIAGGKMKALTGWNSPNIQATNESGFSGKPGGYRDGYGTFYVINITGNWWSSTLNGPVNPWFRSLYYNDGDINRMTNFSINGGTSVRCMKD
jgi:uncharacterized protein (TIGR02145 family)